MISVTEAHNLILSEAQTFRKKSIVQNLSKASGKVLAEDIKAKCWSPPFDQSAMDGFAVNLKNPGTTEINLKIVSEIKAGDNSKLSVSNNSTIRIFTGAKIPNGTTSVIQQENVSIHVPENSIQFPLENYKDGENIRRKGSQFRKGEVLLKKGTLLNAAGIAIAAMAGYSSVKVFAGISASVIVTGNELVSPGKKLKEGQIYESNSLMLQSMLAKEDVQINHTIKAKDDLKSIQAAVLRALNKSNLVLISGGISVGKYDLVKDVLQKLKVKTIFHKVKQKPGKPLYFGRKADKFIFGLPGNPAASMTCFYEYVLPLLNSQKGNQKLDDSLIRFCTLSNSYNKKPGLTHFLKGKITGNTVTVLPDQESYKLTSFAEANCLIVTPEEFTNLETGSNVECHLI